MTEHSKAQTLKIVSYIDTDTDRLSILIDIICGSDKLLAQRGAWVLSHIGDAQPAFVIPYLPQLLNAAERPNHQAVRRSITRLIDRLETPEDLDGRVFDLCFKLAQSTKEDVAVRCFSLGGLERIALKYPELKPEVIELTKAFTSNDSAGMRSRGKRVANTLKESHQRPN